jgi:alpha-2-macroglobulin
MPIKKLFISIFLILSSAVLFESPCQTEKSTALRFNLSNSTVYSPGSEVSISLYSNQGEENSFHFKLFKVEDYGNFILNAKLQNEIRNYDIWGKNLQGLLQYTRLIKEWEDLVNTYGFNQNNQNVNVGKIDDSGNYILQVTKDSLVAYCGISVTDLTIITKISNNQILAMAADAKSGKVISGINFKLFIGTKLINESGTDKDGIVLFPLKDSVNNKDILLTAKTANETLFSDPYFYSVPGADNYLGYIYTNQPVYRPGQHVYFKSVFRSRKDGELENLPNEKFQVKINSLKGKEIYSDTLATNGFGTLSGDLMLDNDAELGQYSIQINKDEQYFSGLFDIEEYKKPEYIVKILPDRNFYSANDTIKASISADYYFGSPVTTGKVNVKVYKQNIMRPWWYWSDYSWFYTNFAGDRFIPYNQRELVTQESGELGKDGEFSYSYKITDNLNADFIYMITADITDNSRNTVTGSTEVHVTRGSFTISTSPVSNRAVGGNSVVIYINTTDFANKPVQTKFIVAFNYPEQRNKNGTYYRPVGDTLTGSTDSTGKALLSFLPKGFYPGNYKYTIIAYDEKGRKITAAGSFYFGNYGNYMNNGNIEIITSKDTYESGDTLTAFISLPQKDEDVLLTYEKSSFLGYEVHHVEGSNISINLKLTDKFSPNFNISIAYCKDGQLFTFSKNIGVLDKSKFLNIKLKPSGNTFKPAEEVNYKILVTDINGNPVKNTELSFGVIDESIYAIKEDPAQDIKSFFYSPESYYIPVNSSRENKFSYGASRRITLIDKQSDIRNMSPKGDGLLSGKLISKDEAPSYTDIFIMLSNNTCFYSIKADSSGKFIFSNIKEGKYDLLVLLDYGEIFNVEKINVGTDTRKDINLGEYTSNFRGILARAGTENAMIKSSMPNVMDFAGAGHQLMRKSSDSFVKPELRNNFVDAVIWKAHVVTDDNGVAEVKFKMPDNLTTWRATVKGITIDSKVGQNTDKTITRKNLIVRLETPRFFREGDEVSVSTIVHNYLSESKKVQINFMPGSFELLGSKITAVGGKQTGIDGPLNNSSKRSYEINIDKDSEMRIDWLVKVTEPTGEAKIKAEALTNEESDAVELKIPVQPKGIKKVEPLNADNSGDGTTNLSFNIPANVNINTAKMSFSAVPSLSGTILKALDDLTGYPYGCVEQTMSKFLPTIIVANTFKEINAPLKNSTITELPKMVNAGLKRLYNLQHPDGGWGWWTNDETHPYMTAYVVYGMSLAKKAGYNVDSTSFITGLNNLKDQVKNSKKIDFTTRAFMLYSLSTALNLDKDINDSLYKKMAVNLAKEKLNPYALSLLAIIFNNFKDNANLTDILKQLSKSAVEEKSSAHWGGKAWHYSWQDDKIQSTAFAVKALMLDKDYSQLVAKAVKWLIQQKQGFSWRSTQETSTVIFALTDYLKTTNELNPHFKTTVYVNNKKEFEKKFTKDDVFENNPTITIDGLNDNLLKPGINKIRIEKSGVGKLYFSGVNTYFSQEKEKTVNKDKFTVTRNYYLLTPVDEGDKIVYEKKKFEGEIKSGQILYVQTKVETKEKDLQYFILEDMLPSGFEAVKNEENFETKPDEEQNPKRTGIMPIINRFYADKEYHDDRVSFFVTNAQNSMEFSYMIQAQVPGKFNVNPAQGYLMYYPEFNGAGNPEKIIVKE